MRPCPPAWAACSPAGRINHPNGKLRAGRPSLAGLDLSRVFYELGFRVTCIRFHPLFRRQYIIGSTDPCPLRAWRASVIDCCTPLMYAVYFGAYNFGCGHTGRERLQLWLEAGSDAPTIPVPQSRTLNPKHGCYSSAPPHACLAAYQCHKALYALNNCRNNWKTFIPVRQVPSV